MTTPDTSAVRAWARSKGYDVADRGRLPAELVDAYSADQRKAGTGGTKPSAARKAPGSKAPAKKAAAKRAPSKKAVASRAPAQQSAAAKATPQKTASTSVAPPAETASQKPAAGSSGRPDPRPKPSPVSDDRRLVALGEQLAALTDRVTALEKAAGSSKGNGKAGAKRFRRSR